MDPTPNPNPRPKWDKKLIEVVGNIAGDPYVQRRTRYQYQYENLALCHIDPLILERCYMMVGYDPHLYKDVVGPI